jgi:hypothetical protein
VTSPGRQAVEVLRDMGYGPADFVRWGGQTRIAAFLGNAIAVSALTSVPSEQADLERMKVVFYRQRALVTETSHVSLAIDGFASTGGYSVKRWLIDATHNNTYGTYVASGLNAAIATERLQQLDTQPVAQLAQIPDVDLAPYAVMLLEIERVAGTNGCASPSSIGDARLIRHQSLHAETETESYGWLEDGPRSIGLTAGASTPNAEIERVIRRVAALRGAEPA